MDLVVLILVVSVLVTVLTFFPSHVAVERIEGVDLYSSIVGSDLFKGTEQMSGVFDLYAAILKASATFFFEGPDSNDYRTSLINTYRWVVGLQVGIKPLVLLEDI